MKSDATSTRTPADLQDSKASLPEVHLVRHGETPWTVSGQHTGLSDIPLSEQGVHQALALGKRLHSCKFSVVFTSPLQRARRTCELAGFGAVAQTNPDLVEWNYGAFEGRTREEILRLSPDWQVFRDGCPGGESVTDVAARADRVVSRLRTFTGRTLLFSSGHFLRVLAARWLGLEASCGRLFLLSTASLSILSYDHDNNEPGIRLWNDVHWPCTRCEVQQD